MNASEGETSARSGLNWVRTGPRRGACVVLLHAVGFDLTYWDRQIEVLRETYDVIALDLPGHGRSSGGRANTRFAEQVAAVEHVIEIAGTGTAHIVGLSFGGIIAQAFALSHPDRVRSLALLGTASRFPEAVRATMRVRAASVRADGMRAVLQASLERWFTPDTRADRPDLIDRVSKTVLADDPEVHAASWDAIAGFDVHDRLHEIGCPTLVVVGEHDPSTPPAAASALAEGVEGAELVVLPGASHIVAVEAPQAVNAALMGFLATYHGGGPAGV